MQDYLLIFMAIVLGFGYDLTFPESELWQAGIASTVASARTARRRTRWRRSSGGRQAATSSQCKTTTERLQLSGGKESAADLGEVLGDVELKYFCAQSKQAE
jgi:hypothetical protein